jgi:IclR family transcriptional regulator, acetate operon repressor
VTTPPAKRDAVARPRADECDVARAGSAVVRPRADERDVARAGSAVVRPRANRGGVGGVVSTPLTSIGHRAANRVVDILELLAASRDGMALREVSAQLEAPKSSLLPLLRALTARGFLEQTRTGEYRLGARVLELGGATTARRELVDVARSALVDLMRRTGETVFLGTLAADGVSVVFVDKVESEQIIRYSADVGDRRPLHATSTGKAILAFLPSEQREALLDTLPLSRHTERTVTSLATLRGSLEEIHRTGVCLSLDELVRGASGVAAPIFDRHGRVAGACTVGGPTDRVRPRLRQLATEVKETARGISSLLGHRPHDDRRPAGRTS